MKKLFCAFLCAAMLLSLLPAGAAALKEPMDADTFAASVTSMVKKYDTAGYVQDSEVPAEKITGESERLVPADVLAHAVDGTASYNAASGMVTFDTVSESVSAAANVAEPGKASLAGDTSEAMVPLEETAEKLGVTVTETESGATLSYSYQTARLITVADHQPDAPGALEIVGGYDDYYLIQYATPSAAMAGEKTIAAEQGVECVSPDSIMTVCDTGAADYEYYSWGPDAIGAREFNNNILSNCNNDLSKMPEVTVAVIDTGIDTDNSFLQDRIVTPYDFFDGDSIPEDENGHGTHVAGIVADTTLPNVKIMPLKVGSADGAIDVSYAVLGIERAVKYGAKVINLSISGWGTYDVMEKAVENAYAAGTLCVAAAGNDMNDAKNKYPANIKCALTVSALSNSEDGGQTYKVPSFSNFGDVVDLSAPGDGIKSAYLNNGYKTMSGTSMAAPFVSAAAAAVYTEMALVQGENAPTPLRISRLLCMNAVDKGEEGKDIYYGYGMLSLKNLDESTWQAEISGIKYDTLAAAVEAASDGDVIDIPWRVEISSAITVNKKITIRAIHNLEIARAFDYQDSIFNITSGGSLAFDCTDGSITVDGNSSQGSTLISVDVGGSLSLSRGVMLCNNRCQGNGGAIFNAGSLAINGATIKNTFAAQGHGNYIFNSGVISVSGDTSLGIKGDIYLCQGTILDVAGTLTGSEIAAAITIQNEAAGTEVIKFPEGAAVQQNKFRLLSDTLELKVQGQSLFTTTASDNQACIGGVKYATLVSAISNAQDGDVIFLNKSVTLNSTVAINKKITISSPEGYVIYRDIAFKGDLLSLSQGSSLTLGVSGGEEALTIDGAGVLTSGSMIKLPLYKDAQGTNVSGSLIINNGVTLQNQYSSA